MIHSTLFCVCIEGNNSKAFWSEMRSLNGGEQGLVLDSNFRIMISHIKFYSNKISVSVYYNFSCAYTALSDIIDGNFLAIIL